MNRRRKQLNLKLFALAFVIAMTAASAQATAAPSQLMEDQMVRGTGMDQHLGSRIPLDAEFVDEAGQPVRLGDYFGDKPVILTPVYFECPMLCSLVLNGLVKTLNELKFNPGEDFNIVTFSIDPEETPSLARAKKNNYLKMYTKSTEDSWHFLTGNENAIKEVTDATGFRYKYDPRSGEFAHPAAIMIVTADGKISHYFYGTDFSARDIRLALTESSAKKIGNAVDQILLLCYHYDPTTGKYGLAIMNALRIAGTLTVLAMVFFMIHSLRQEKKSGAGV